MDELSTLSQTLPQKAELSNLPTEIQCQIIKHVITGAMPPYIHVEHLDHLGIDETVQMGISGLFELHTDEITLQLEAHMDHRLPSTNETGIPSGSLNIARVSKHFYDVAIRVLYSDRCFEVGASLGEWAIPELPTHPRWDFLKSIDETRIDIEYPLDCLELLTLYTPARGCLAHLLLHINAFMMAETPEPQFLRMIKALRGLRVLELHPSVRLMRERKCDEIFAIVEKIDHVQTIVASATLNARKDDLLEAVRLDVKLTARNKNWKPPCQASPVPGSE